MSTFIPNVSSLSTRIIRILGCNPGRMTLQGTNTYLIGTGKKRVLLDCSDSNFPEYIGLLQNVLKEQKCSLQHIVVSHWHHDHIGGAPDILKELDYDCTVSKLPRSSGFEDFNVVPQVKYNYLKDGEKICTEGATLKVVATPGHADDHIILYLEEENCVFSGDCILGEGSVVLEDLHDYMKSLNIILKLDPIKIFPGHGPVIENGKAKIIEYIQHRIHREKQILCELKKVKPNGLTAKELVELIYVDTPKSLHSAAEMNVKHHLEKLIKDKVVGILNQDKANSKYHLLQPETS